MVKTVDAKCPKFLVMLLKLFFLRTSHKQWTFVSKGQSWTLIILDLASNINGAPFWLSWILWVWFFSIFFVFTRFQLLVSIQLHLPKLTFILRSFYLEKRRLRLFGLLNITRPSLILIHHRYYLLISLCPKVLATNSQCTERLHVTSWPPCWCN